MATKLKKLVLNEVSLVDRGANQHAHVTLFKRDDADEAEIEAYLKRKFDAKERKSDAKSGKALPDGSFPIENTSDLKNAIRAYGRAKDKDAAKRHIISRARALGATAELPADWKVGKSGTLDDKIGEATDALAKSVASILEDAEADRPAALAETFKQYHDHLQTLVPAGVSDAVTAALAAHTVSKDQDMTDKTAEVAKQLEEANAALAKANKELAFHKLSDAHKTYATETKLEGEALDAFVAKSAAERDEHIKTAPVEKKVDPEIAKRDQEIADMRKRLDAADEAKVVAEFAKKAADLGLPEAKGDMLRKAYSGDKTAQAEVETLIKGLREQIKTGKLFDEFGTKQEGDATSPRARVMAKVAEIRKANPTIDTDAKAIAKIAGDVSLRDLWNEYKAAPAV